MQGKNTIARVNASIRNPVGSLGHGRWGVGSERYLTTQISGMSWEEIDSLLQLSEEEYARDLAIRVYEHRERLL